MSQLNSSLPKVPADQAFIVTIGVPHADTRRHCDRALQALARAGFHAGPTSNESIRAIAAQVDLVDGLAANDYRTPAERGDDE